MKDSNSNGLPPPVFIPDWSIWDRVITYHYEEASRPAKDFMYELIQLNVDRPIKLSVIPYELKLAIDAAFGGRPIFDFLLEHGTAIETLPSLLTKSFNTLDDSLRLSGTLIGFQIHLPIKHVDIYEYIK